MTIASPVAQPITVADVPPPGNGGTYGSRWERSYGLSFADADRLQAVIGQKVPFDTKYPNPQTLQTVYVRPLGKQVPTDKFRIRRYLDSPNEPSHLEFKDKVLENGVKVTKKTRIMVPHDTAARLLWGEKGVDVVDRTGRTGKDLEVANRAIHTIDKLHIRPVARSTYRRTSFEDEASAVRVTFDRDIRFTGIGALTGAGEGTRNLAIMDVKVGGTTPTWLSGLLDAELAAGTIRELEDGKGETAVTVLKEQLKNLKPGQ
jgi:hypothetical protein